MRRLLILLSCKLGLIHSSGVLEVSVPRWSVEGVFPSEGSSFDWGQIGGVLDPGANGNKPKNWTFAGPDVDVREVPLSEAEGLEGTGAEAQAKDPPPDGAQPQTRP